MMLFDFIAYACIVYTFCDLCMKYKDTINPILSKIKGLFQKSDTDTNTGDGE